MCFRESNSIVIQVGITHDLVGIDRKAIDVAEPQTYLRQSALIRGRHQIVRDAPIIEHHLSLSDDFRLATDVGKRDCKERDDGQ